MLNENRPGDLPVFRKVKSMFRLCNNDSTSLLSPLFYSRPALSSTVLAAASGSFGEYTYLRFAGLSRREEEGLSRRTKPNRIEEEEHMRAVTQSCRLNRGAESEMG